MISFPFVSVAEMRKKATHLNSFHIFFTLRQTTINQPTKAILRGWGKAKCKREILLWSLKFSFCAILKVISSLGAFVRSLKGGLNFDRFLQKF